MNKMDIQYLKKVTVKVEIWSDVVCPWCYIGKRRFELALDKFEHKKDVSIEWKSFQLDPNTRPEPGINIHQSLARKKGWTEEYARQMNDHVPSLAAKVGLTYNFDKVVVANTFDAHRLMQFAKKQGAGSASEERLFKAYFTEGRNLNDHTTLVELGADIGLDPSQIATMLSTDECREDVEGDAYDAFQLGIHGVPFFVLNEKYGISGAQEPEVFLSSLQKAWTT